MGVVFTLQQLLNNRIPSIDDYISTKRMSKDEFQELHDLGFIHGVLFYGSFSNDNDFRIGSDIDLKMIVNSLKFKFAERLRNFNINIKKKNVPLEYNPLTREQVEQGFHGMEPCFLETLKTYVSEENIIGNNPLDLVKQRIYTHDKIVDFFIKIHEGNLKILGRDSFEPKYDTDYCKFLTRMLNYTLFLPKEMFFVKTHKIPTKNGKSLSKLELVELYTDEFKEIDPEPIQKIASLWQSYRVFFEKKPYDPSKYTKLLDKIAGCYESIERFTRQNMELAKKLPSSKPVLV